MGFEISFIKQQCQDGFNAVHRFGSTWLNRGVEWINIGINNVPPHIQKNRYVVLAVTFCACLMIIDLSIRLGSFVSKAVPQNRRTMRQAVDSTVTLITICGLLYKLGQFVQRSNQPITWFAGSLCLLGAVVIRGSYEA